MIDVSRKFLDPSMIFQIEVEEALDNVKIAIRNLKEFKTCFQEYKMKLPSYFPPDVPPKLWEFQVGLLHVFYVVFEFVGNRNCWYSKDLTAFLRDCIH